MSAEALTNRLLRSKNRLIRNVLCTVLISLSTGCDSIDFKQQNITPTASLVEKCSVYLILSAHYFKDYGGQLSPYGNPMFEPEIDQITGPVVNRRYIVGDDANFIPAMFITGPDGFTNKVYAENGPEHLTEPKVPILGDSFVDNQGQKVILMSVKSAESKIKKDYLFPCDATITIDIKIPENQPNIDDFPEVPEVKLSDGS